MISPDLRASLRTHVLATALPGESPDNLQDTTPLQSSGILDSMAVLGLASFIMDTFGVELDVYDMSAERFDTISDIATIVERKREAIAQSAQV